MTISQYFPIYDQLDKADQERLDYAAVKRRVPKGTLLHGGDGVCTGLLVIASGQLRAHMISEEGGRSLCTGCLSGISACFRLPAS